jgi:hypothetical protein
MINLKILFKVSALNRALKQQAKLNRKIHKLQTELSQETDLSVFKDIFSFDPNTFNYPDVTDLCSETNDDENLEKLECVDTDDELINSTSDSHDGEISEATALPIEPTLSEEDIMNLTDDEILASLPEDLRVLKDEPVDIEEAACALEIETSPSESTETQSENSNAHVVPAVASNESISVSNIPCITATMKVRSKYHNEKTGRFNVMVSLVGEENPELVELDVTFETFDTLHVDELYLFESFNDGSHFYTPIKEAAHG